MAKINHNNFVDTVNDIVSQAKERKVIHLKNTKNEWNGKSFTIEHKDLVNLGTCGYLGLETHPELIKSASDFVIRHGTQFSISRAYVVSEYNLELEEKLSQIFDGHKTLIFSSTSLAHVSIVPLVMSQNDAIILDQQAHFSMQTACQLMAAKGTTLDIIRHNNLEMLERKIQSLRDTHEKIWYVLDGVYSMYGDLAPVEELNQLANKYPSLHFYVDDAHGISWAGKNGCGCVFETMKKNKRTILLTTMAKGFGSIGGIVVFPDRKSFERVNTLGGALAHSHPVAPSVIGASIASANIHLSDEIYKLQESLKDKINYCNNLLEQFDLPVLSDSKTPIYFIGTGQPKVGYNLNKRLLNKGFYVSIAMFPAVSVKNTGIRFTITNHISKKEIEQFLEVLKMEYYLALEEEGVSLSAVHKAFKLPFIEKDENTRGESSSELVIKTYNSIKKIDKKLWDQLFYEKGNFDWEGMRSLEEGFTDNKLPEQNWGFLYIIVRDKISGKVVLATFFTECIMKDDMLTEMNISKEIEKIRLLDKYHLTSKALIMGCLISEGQHLVIDKKHRRWKESAQLMCNFLTNEKSKRGINNTVLRDFNPEEKELKAIFHEMGFFKVDMPNSNIIYNLDRYNTESYFQSLSKKNKKNIKRDVLRYEHLFESSVSDLLTQKELDIFYCLYESVAKRNNALNIYKYPKKTFKAFNESRNWEFFIVKERETSKILSITCCYKSKTTYFPIAVGIDYESELKVYKQLLYQITLFAIKKGYQKICFGFSADTEKRKLGAVQEPRVAYLSIDDLYNMEKIDKIRGT